MSIAPASLIAPVAGAGRLFQVSPVSDQPLPVPRSAGPSTCWWSTRRRSFALVTRPVMPATWKRRKLSTGVSSVRSRFAVPKFVAGLRCLGPDVGLGRERERLGAGRERREAWP